MDKNKPNNCRGTIKGCRMLLNYLLDWHQNMNDVNQKGIDMEM